jgi:hypothetical protein
MVKKTTKKTSAPGKMPMMYKDEKKWQAESDARTLMQAEEIKRDSARIKAAYAQAKKQIEELSRVVKK